MTAKKHEAARLRFMPRQRRFIIRRIASYGKAVFHFRLTMKHCSVFPTQYEATPLTLHHELLAPRVRIY